MDKVQKLIDSDRPFYLCDSYNCEHSSETCVGIVTEKE
jgi:hypothetical protein